MLSSFPRARTLGAAVGAALLAASLASCGVIDKVLDSNAEPQRDEPNGQITASSDASVFALKIGDCFNAAALAELVDDVPVLPCADPHDSEVFAETELPKGAYPTDLDEQAETFCTEQFLPFIGASYDPENSNYVPWPFTPTAESWAQGDRVIQCVAGTYDDSPVTGSLKGAADLEAAA